jgi:predicted nicotinamide N-methyase
MGGGGQRFATTVRSWSCRTRSAIPSTASVVSVKDDSDLLFGIDLPVSISIESQQNNVEWIRDDSKPQEGSTDDSGLYNPPEIVVMRPDQPKIEQMLLLEGDQYHLSEHGIARSFYQIVLPSASSSSSRSSSREDQEKRSEDNSDLRVPSSICIEEFYDLAGARKSFIVRDKKKSPFGTSICSSTGHMFLGEAISFPPSSSLSSPLILCEINGADSARAGTGSRTWDSSIVMSMYFASRPDLLYGDVIELGSGVGLGAILCCMVRASMQPHSDPLCSMTLTDVQEQVLEQCSQNVSKLGCGLGQYELTACSRKKQIVPIRVGCLDWHDIDRQSGDSIAHTERYDTILACDCAYLYPDIKALVSTMMALPRKRDTSRIHAFGPINRGGMIQLLQELRDEPGVDVEVEIIDMVRHRLELPSRLGKANTTELNADPIEVLSLFAAADKSSRSVIKSEAKFLHVTCTLRSSQQKRNAFELLSDSIADID